MEILLAFVLVGIAYVGFNVVHRAVLARREKYRDGTIEQQIASLRRERRIDVPNTRAKRANVQKPRPWMLDGSKCSCRRSD